MSSTQPDRSDVAPASQEMLETVLGVISTVRDPFAFGVRPAYTASVSVVAVVRLDGRGEPHEAIDGYGADQQNDGQQNPPDRRRRDRGFHRIGRVHDEFSPVSASIRHAVSARHDYCCTDEPTCSRWTVPVPSLEIHGMTTNAQVAHSATVITRRRSTRRSVNLQRRLNVLGVAAITTHLAFDLRARMSQAPLRERSYGYLDRWITGHRSRVRWP
jgi:hypothetical protein